jgi:thioesterase domain-containing protein
MYLYPLASYLGHPFYALQTPGLDGTPTPDSVEALARYHLQALQQQQPTGPYHIMGHSSGGRVAFDMARQLEQQGERVAFLAILDTGAPDSTAEDVLADYTERQWLSDIVRLFEELISSHLNCPLATLQALPDVESAYTQVMQAFITQDILFAPGTPVDDLKALVNTYRVTVQGHSHYHTQGKLNCPIHLFRARDKSLGSDGVEFEDRRPAWGWANHTHANVIEHDVPGTHVTMMAAPQVQVLAAAIQSCLQTDCSNEGL